VPETVDELLLAFARFHGIRYSKRSGLIQTDLMTC
jgi:hypothetical protein